MLEVRVENLDEVLKAMREFTPKLQRKGLTQALRKGMRPVVRAARAKAPVDTGALKKAIVARVNTKMGRRVGGAVVQVGIRGGAKEYVDSSRNRARVIKRGKHKGIFVPGRVGESYEQGGNQFYFRFLEFGTSKLPARPFLRPALAENAQKTTDIVTAELRKAIERIASTGK